VKLFKTKTIDIVNYCRTQFNFELSSNFVSLRSRKFEVKYRRIVNVFCKSRVYFVSFSIFLFVLFSTTTDESQMDMGPFIPTQKQSKAKQSEIGRRL